LSVLYLIRHGQAGPRHNYDALSALGQQQARLLGAYLAEQGVPFAALHAGGLNRQQQTAQIVRECFQHAGRHAPAIAIDERWNEFSLAAVYRGIVAQLIAEREDFARDYAEMQIALQADPHVTGGAAGRCDRAVIQAWMENRYPDYDGESWVSFRARVQACLADLARYNSGEQVAVFTSATPIAIWVGLSLHLSDEKLLSLLGVIQNSSLTTLRVRHQELTLFTFNATPHLPDGSLRTFR
jgi:broad specificity phosphatase PhoE